MIYGFCGVFYVIVCIDFKYFDFYFGVDGSNMLLELLIDLMLFVSKFKDCKNYVNILGFYDGIFFLIKEEDFWYDDIVNIFI